MRKNAMANPIAEHFLTIMSVANPTFEPFLFVMKQFSNAEEISVHLSNLAKEGHSIGFVPTMGALHKGHLELIHQAKSENSFVVCSIFVNPLQFNRQEDLNNYPNRLNQDIAMLEKANCDIVFIPGRQDIFPEQPDLDFDFGTIGKGMEAEFRPNHFEGVAAVINRFLEILTPNKAYFGEKDYQQLAIVKWLTQQKQFKTEIVACDTIRFKNGLAMSSRNLLLKETEFETASKIYACLNYCKKNKSNYSPVELAKKCFEILKQDFEPEYFIIADEQSMKPLKEWSDSTSPRAFVAAYLSTVRLIDNLSLNN